MSTDDLCYATNVTWSGNEALRSLLVPIDSLQRDHRNARVHGDRSIKVIKNSYRRWGQQKPIVALDTGVIIAGNGQHEAAVALGWTHIATVRFPNRDEAKAFALTDNRSAELSLWDFEVLADDFEELRLQGHDLAELGWEAPDMRPEWARGPYGTDVDGGQRSFGRSIPMTSEQRAVFDQAARIIREGDTAAEVSDGRVVELLAAEFLAGA